MLILVKDTNSGILFKVTNQKVINPMGFNETKLKRHFYLFTT